MRQALHTPFKYEWGDAVIWNSIGAIKVSGLRHLLRFLLISQRIKSIAKRCEGCLGVELFREGDHFFVLSFWDCPAAMKRFAMDGQHARLMQNDTGLYRHAHNVIFETRVPVTRMAAMERWRDSLA